MPSGRFSGLTVADTTRSPYSSYSIGEAPPVSLSPRNGLTVAEWNHVNRTVAAAAGTATGRAHSPEDTNTPDAP